QITSHFEKLKIQSQKEIIEFKLIKTAGYVVHAKVNRTAVVYFFMYLGALSDFRTEIGEC
ncbi:MAG: hypothetical protein ABSG91_22375, partial [Syntrophobacteraceae bacterium]